MSDENPRSIVETFLDYEMRGSFKLSPIHWVPYLSAHYYLWKTRKKLARWRKSREAIGNE